MVLEGCWQRAEGLWAQGKEAADFQLGALAQICGISAATGVQELGHRGCLVPLDCLKRARLGPGEDLMVSEGWLGPGDIADGGPDVGDSLRSLALPARY